jgi:hypothetical protein
MKEMKDKIIEAMDTCIVTDDEWKEILTNKLTQDIKGDPFESSVFDDDQGN